MKRVDQYKNSSSIPYTTLKVTHYLKNVHSTLFNCSLFNGSTYLLHGFLHEKLSSDFAASQEIPRIY
jgi:hypothetical protein